MSAVEVLDFLGGRSALAGASRSRSAKNPAPPDKPLQFRLSAAARLAVAFKLSVDEMLAVIDVTGRTTRRRKAEGVLTAAESDRLYRLARITQYAETVFDDPDKGHAWLKQPNPNFGGSPPLELLGTDRGAKLIEDELTRIEYGDFA